MKRRRYWYRLEITACPICGREREVRFRVYVKAQRGRQFFQRWDYCDL